MWLTCHLVADETAQKGLSACSSGNSSGHESEHHHPTPAPLTFSGAGLEPNHLICQWHLFGVTSPEPRYLSGGS